MKKFWILLLAAAVIQVSCVQEVVDPVNGDDSVGSSAITFHLAANHPEETKVVKGGWEEGDAIFVFFSGSAAPKHLKMTYNGSSWTCAEYDGATQRAGALGMKNGDTGTMRGIFLPFGSNATVSASGTSFTFSTTYYAYYLTASLSYTVSNNKVEGVFNMEIPEDYVQFFVEDKDAEDGCYKLGTDAVIPVGVASIAADGSIVETSDKAAGNDMVGYAYGSGDARGYLFSGKLAEWSYGANYYFAKTKVTDGSRADYFVKRDKALASRNAVKLPANDNVYGVQGDKPAGKWVPVGSGKTVPLLHVVVSDNGVVRATSLGTWYTCNYNSESEHGVPEDLGSLYYFVNAKEIEGITLPTKEQFELLVTYCSWTWLKVHGQPGVVVADQGFLFLPAKNDQFCEYWSSTNATPHENAAPNEVWGWYLYFASGGNLQVLRGNGSYEYAVRPIQ